uniref:Uncharacterized protein TCIL3000_10_8420 n=1 Tax=Trypanosoma congolense (strain IL3000) TaxID=1068625 RepID=G0UXE9_TRYCI|nr:unnamed protein product [Trypanosoma congolense IL3000]
MRVLTCHQHHVNRNSAALGGLTRVNVAYSLLFVFPATAVSLFERSSGALTSLQRALCVAGVGAWALLDMLRLYVGHCGNHQQNVLLLVLFTLFTLLPQLPVAVLCNMKWPYPNSLDYAVSVVMILFLVLELLCSVGMIIRLIQNNRIDYFVYGPHHPSRRNH